MKAMCRTKKPGDSTQQVCLDYFRTKRRCSLSTPGIEERTKSLVIDTDKQMSLKEHQNPFDSGYLIELQNWLTTVSCVEHRVLKCIASFQLSKNIQSRSHAKWESPVLLREHVVSLRERIPKQLLESPAWLQLYGRFDGALQRLQPLLLVRPTRKRKRNH
jgi:hypothetical protein